MSWGRALQENILEPIKILIPFAPDELLNSIISNCSNGCTFKNKSILFTFMLQLSRVELLKCLPQKSDLCKNSVFP